MIPTNAATRCTARALLGAAGLLLGGCATINPTLAPARVLPAAGVAVDVGSAYASPVVAPTLVSARQASAQISAGSDTPENRDALARGAMAYGVSPPGVGGYLAARVGFGHQAEGQVSLAGRTVRAGARRVFWSDHEGIWALSLGAQARVAPLAVAMDGTIPDLAIRSSLLYGGDVSMVLGGTKSDLYDAWLGVRVGYTHGDGSLQLAVLNAGAPFDASLDRIDAAATLGIRAGFGHIAALAEIEADVSYFWVGSSIGTQGSGATFALIPAGAISIVF